MSWRFQPSVPWLQCLRFTLPPYLGRTPEWECLDCQLGTLAFKVRARLAPMRIPDDNKSGLYRQCAGQESPVKR
jgi:hypothetical protein